MRAGSGVCGRRSDSEEDYHGKYESSACQHNTTASDTGIIEHRNRALTRGKASPGLRRPPSCPGSTRENGPWRGAMDRIRGPEHNERGQQGACLTPAATAAMLTHSQPSWLGTGGTLQLPPPRPLMHVRFTTPYTSLEIIFVFPNGKKSMRLYMRERALSDELPARIGARQPAQSRPCPGQVLRQAASLEGARCHAVARCRRAHHLRTRE